MVGEGEAGLFEGSRPSLPRPQQGLPHPGRPPRGLQRGQGGGRGGLAAGGLAGGGVHAAAHHAPTAQAAGGTLEGLHAAVPLHVQVLQPPALPAPPKLHLDLRGKRRETEAITQNNCPQNGRSLH